ncbi:phosphotransferase [Streptomyces sp. ISL-94]|uniref:phosphotransferase n=1 Tax=Streptomyces sp. ISL-94 TaxID=2819190 RepID=UPI001BEA7AB4|nr:phosphotransferase [Streptomyces sp. ISL-94]MBT2478372.1 phosphotransferase [Streptomyces sp. ISL-94]
MGFTKTYATAEAALRAQAHHAWLDRLGVPVPRLHGRRGRHRLDLLFEALPDRHIGPGDLPETARLLGQAHAAAYRDSLHRARLDQPFPLPGVGTLEPFTTPRIARVQKLLDAGTVPEPAFTSDQAARVITTAAGEPAAFYKDANPRNFLITQAGIAVIDFDDLTLAPFGYDLAKLILTTAMTHGPLPGPLTAATLNSYNQAVPHPCSADRLNDWLEIHHILTSPYLGRHGYIHGWHTLRPTETRTR